MTNPYFSYLLRIWFRRTLPGQWMASLEEPHTHQIITFDSLTALNAYLENLTSKAGIELPEQKEEGKPQQKLS